MGHTVDTRRLRRNEVCRRQRHGGTRTAPTAQPQERVSGVCSSARRMWARGSARADATPTMTCRDRPRTPSPDAPRRTSGIVGGCGRAFPSSQRMRRPLEQIWGRIGVCLPRTAMRPVHRVCAFLGFAQFRERFASSVDGLNSRPIPKTHMPIVEISPPAALPRGSKSARRRAAQRNSRHDAVFALAAIVYRLNRSTGWGRAASSAGIIQR